MLISVQNLRKLIREAISLDDAVETEITRLGRDVLTGKAEATIKIAGKLCHIEIRHDVDGYTGWVDYTNFGGGKTPRAAMTALRRRLAFLATAPERPVVSGADMEARMADAELRRREREERQRR